MTQPRKRPAREQRNFVAAYDELRRLAQAQLQTPGHTLQPTALVHEVWLRMAKSRRVPEDRAHFLATAAKAMRHVLVDHERRRRRQKRGGEAHKATLIDTAGAMVDGGIELLDIEDALRALEGLDQRKARVVELRVFAGATIAETAEVLGVSHMTVSSDWQLARRWLSSRLL